MSCVIANESSTRNVPVGSTWKLKLTCMFVAISCGEITFVVPFTRGRFQPPPVWSNRWPAVSIRSGEIIVPVPHRTPETFPGFVYTAARLLFHCTWHTAR